MFGAVFGWSCLWLSYVCGCVLLAVCCVLRPETAHCNLALAVEVRYMAHCDLALAVEVRYSAHCDLALAIELR